MANMDYSNDYNRQQRLKKYDDLKLFLSSKDKEGKVNEYLEALFYLNEMEHTIESQKEELDRYKSFFRMLQTFLPRTFSPNYIIY